MEELFVSENICLLGRYFYLPVQGAGKMIRQADLHTKQTGKALRDSPLVIVCVPLIHDAKKRYLTSILSI